MMNLFRWLILLVSFCACVVACKQGPDPVAEESQPETPDIPEGFPTDRDPYQWPFASSSVWNMPIGTDAQYVHAKIERAESRGLTIDEDLIVLTPDAPAVDILTSSAGWSREKSRCDADGGLLFSAPLPADFVVSPDTWDGATPNSGLAVLMPDGKTIKQTQPFAYCGADASATSKYTFDDVSLYGDGIYGAHGGSGLSAIGGALRVGELRPTSGPIRHVLKVNLYAAKNLFFDEMTKGYRWPAARADGYAAGSYGTKRSTPVVKEARMGALLALPPSLDIELLQMETQPARILAEALTHYGAYVVDDTAWDVYALVCEWGPNGRFQDQFEQDWGFSMQEASKDTPWARDIDKLFMNLHVVNNNTAATLGGGGETLQPLAPELIQ